MARGYNKVTLMGNLARDPDVRTTQNGQKVARFTLAVNQVWKDKQTGEKKERADFIGCQAWGNTAEIVERYLRKGNPCLVEGRLSVRKFEEHKTGQHRWVTEVIIDIVILLGGNKQDGGSSQGGYQSQGAPAAYGGYGQTAATARPQPGGYDEQFPLDFSRLDNPDDNSDDVDIPF